MYIPIEYLSGSLLIAIILVGITTRALWRRELFWRYAFISASDEAFRQLESIKEGMELLVEEETLKPENVPFRCIGGKRIAQLRGRPDNYYDSEMDLSAEELYTKHIDYLHKLCTENGYLWVTKEDKGFPLS